MNSACWTRALRSGPMETLVDLARMNSTRYGMVRLYSTLSGEAIDGDHPAHPWLRGHLSNIVTDIAAGFEAGKKLGTVRAEAPSVSIARSVVAVMDGLQIQWLAARDRPFTASDQHSAGLITDADLAMPDMGETSGFSWTGCGDCGSFPTAARRMSRQGPRYEGLTTDPRQIHDRPGGQGDLEPRDHRGNPMSVYMCTSAAGPQSIRADPASSVTPRTNRCGSFRRHVATITVPAVPECEAGIAVVDGGSAGRTSGRATTWPSRRRSTASRWASCGGSGCRANPPMPSSPRRSSMPLRGAGWAGNWQRPRRGRRWRPGSSGSRSWVHSTNVALRRRLRAVNAAVAVDDPDEFLLPVAALLRGQTRPKRHDTSCAVDESRCDPAGRWRVRVRGGGTPLRG